MFGISLMEAVIIGAVTLVVVGPQKLPGMMKSMGEWMTKLRRMTSEMRAQSGIDDVLKAEGIHGGLTELRGMLRGELPLGKFDAVPRGDSWGQAGRPAGGSAGSSFSPYDDAGESDRWREYPPEGPDAYGCLPDDLVDDEAMLTPALAASSATASASPHAQRTPATTPDAGPPPGSPPWAAPSAASAVTPVRAAPAPPLPVAAPGPSGPGTPAVTMPSTGAPPASPASAVATTAPAPGQHR